MLFPFCIPFWYRSNYMPDKLSRRTSSMIQRGKHVMTSGPIIKVDRESHWSRKQTQAKKDFNSS